MSINAVNNTKAYSTSQKTGRTANGELGKDDFLKLLVAQMQNQNPLSPMEDREMISQMAQFSLLEQMKALNESYMSSQALELIGKAVYAEPFDEALGITNPVIGKVDSVVFRDGQVKLSVSGRLISLSDIRQVGIDG